MSVTGISGTQAPAAGAGQKTSTTSVAMTDFDQFLNLFVSQLKYQDPLSPMESDEFLAQTAQFSSVEQLVNLNTAVGDLTYAQLVSDRSTGAAMIGKTVTASAVGDDGEAVPVSGRVVQVLYDTSGMTLLGLEDGSTVPLASITSISEL